MGQEPLYFEDYGSVLEELSAGRCVSCTVHGRSMRPFFKPGKDILVIAPIKFPVISDPEEEHLILRHDRKSEKKKRNATSSEDRMSVRRRDLVLFRQGGDGPCRLLRVVHVWGTLLLLRGDGCYGPYERATVSDVVGVAVSGTILGGIKTDMNAFFWRSLSKMWTASYRFRLWFRKFFRTLPVFLFLLSLLSVSCREKEAVTVDGGYFIRDGRPYYFIGTNFWYGALLGSPGPGGDRPRLKRELDSLCNMGIRNLRVLAGAEGSGERVSRISPVLQPQPGIYDPQLLEGLDYLLAEMGSRGMEAVIYLNNAWEWSGGFSQYLEWAGHGPAKLPAVDGYEAYCDYVSAFQQSEKAKSLAADHLRFIVSRTNSLTGIPYKDDPAVFSWQICNEPRPFGEENRQAFAAWIADCAAVIRSVDPNHLISAGSEGKYGCEADLELWEEIGRIEEIDYLNIHVWPLNWGWTGADDMQERFPEVLDKSREYVQEHVRIAERLGKPLTIEEFGFPRDGKCFSPDSGIVLRDRYYAFMLEQVEESARNGGIVAGCNFWGWGGNVHPAAEQWKKGDPYTGDPAQEPQGLYSVFQSDHSTVALIRAVAERLEKKSVFRE